ncbi:ATP-dependent Clp protease ATP-binding subunit [Candidatus Uhrbacteria bacterium]|nr:ATP-dependent Clp protease ATP-binding subunit [Candidatus Uhrbacteria bacterium]
MNPSVPRPVIAQKISFATENVIYEWPFLLTPAAIRGMHAQNILRVIIDGILLMVGLGSFFLFAVVHVPVVATDQASPLFFIQSTHWTAQLFWISLLFDMWFIQRINREYRTRTQVLSRDEEESYKEQRQDKTFDLLSVYDTAALHALGDALLFAQRHKSKELTPLHLFIVLFQNPVIQHIAARISLDPAALKQGMHAALATIPVGTSAPVGTESFYSLLLRAYRHAQDARKKTVDCIDLFVATLDDETHARELMEELGVKLETIDSIVAWFNAEKVFRHKRAEIASVAALRPRADIDRAMTGRATHLLNQYGGDLTRLAQYGKLIFPVGRDEILDSLLTTIGSTAKNILLVGDTGTGKSTLINGIAYAMAGEQVPHRLKDKRLVQISAGHIAASSNPPALFQELLDEALMSGNILLVISNIHDFTGHKGLAGFDLAEMLAETIERTGLMVFATTTPGDFHRYLEGQLITSLFDRIDVREPDEQTTIQIVEAHIPIFESRHAVYFTYDAIATAVQLSGRYLPDTHNPQKAIDLCEQAALELGGKKRKVRTVITPADIAHVLEQRTHTKVGMVEGDERTVLLNLEDKIHERMVDQETAVSAVANAMRRARVELREAKRPVAVFLFLGPTGVGKTELAKTLAEVYFGSEETMIRLDMSEYQDATAIQRLTGITGSDVRGGMLTEAVRKAPFSLLLLDELEKAALDVRNLFLQVFEDGRLTDNTGELIDFTNTIIIATSNAGSQYIQDALRAHTPTVEIKTGLLEDELRHYYTPEFLNRFDDIIIFQTLSEEHIRQIARLMVNSVQHQMEKKGVFFEVTDAAVAELALAGFDPEFGARPLRRVIQQRVNDTLAKILLEQKVSRRDKIVLDAGSAFRIEKVARFIK